MGSFLMKFACALPVALAVLLAVTDAEAQEQPLAPATQVASSDSEMDKILSLDISDLTVTSASKRTQKLTDTAAAVYVITQEDIKRSGATTIPDALRMVPGLEVAQTSSDTWAIASRGFNNALSDKLLVMIDGRSIYSPVHSGVYWDDQSTFLPDIERIEVIRGPGSSLWGANAVDGIINIITKNAADTQGNYVSAAVGTAENFVEGRQGGKTDDNTFYRVYGQYSHYGPTQNMNNDDNNDSWYRGRSGFRVDSTPSGQDSYTVQGDVYGGQQNTQQTLPIPVSPFSATTAPDDSSYGGNILARWNHQVSSDSSTSLQAYIDHYSLLQQDIADQHVSTADIQFQNNIKLDDRNNFIWGAGSRFYYEDILGTFEASFNDPSSTHYIFNTFAQDEYAIVRDKVFLTLGSKFEYNDYTGFEFEPSSRIAWHLTDTQMVWAAVSRAVRTPSSIEEDVSLAAEVLPTTPATVFRLEGNPDQKDEDLIAYEIGHRIQPVRNLSFDTTAYYNDFNNLLTLGPPGTPVMSNGLEVVPYEVNNLGSGHVFGAEEAASWNVTSNWRLMGSYTFLKMVLEEPPSNTASLQSTEGLAPEHQFSVRSYWNVTDKVQWDNMLYYVSAITPPAGTYFRYDTRVGWQIVPGIEASLIGRNLLDNEHAEFPATPQAQIPRSALAQISWKF